MKLTYLAEAVSGTNHPLDHLLYHGTTDAFLDSILRSGLASRPGQKVWGNTLKSFDGSYVATAPGRAWKFSIDAVNKFGGSPIIIVTDKSSSHASADEDLIIEFLYDRHEGISECCEKIAQKHGLEGIAGEEIILAYTENDDLSRDILDCFAEELGWYFDIDGLAMLGGPRHKAMEEFVDSVVSFGYLDMSTDLRILPKDPMIRLMDAMGLVAPYYSNDDEDRPGTTARFAEGIKTDEIMAIIRPDHANFDEDGASRITSIRDIPHEVIYDRDRDAQGQLRIQFEGVIPTDRIRQV